MSSRQSQKPKKGNLVALNLLSSEAPVKRFEFLPGENTEEFTRLLTGLEQDFHAVTTTEKALIRKMAEALWKKQRLLWVENMLIQAQAMKKEMAVTQAQKEEIDNGPIKRLEEESDRTKAGCERLKFWLSEAEATNRIRNRKRFQDEAREWAADVYESVYTLDRDLDATLSLEERQDSLNKKRKTSAGEYSFLRWLSLQWFKDTFHIQDPDKKGTDQADKDRKAIDKPLDLSSLENYLKRMEERLKFIEAELKKAYDLLELEKQIKLAGFNLMLNEEELQKIQRHEQHLDNQFYRALAELQKLQAFLIKKNELTGFKNGFSPENGQSSDTIDAVCAQG